MNIVLKRGKSCCYVHHEGVYRIGVTSLLIPYLSSRWKWVVSLMPQPFYPCSKHSHHQSIRMLGRPEKVWTFWKWEKSLAHTRNWTIIPLLSSTIASSLNQLHYLSSSVLVQILLKIRRKVFVYECSAPNSKVQHNGIWRQDSNIMSIYICLWLLSTLEISLLGKQIPGSGAAPQEATSTTPVIWRSHM
jgi:hypothetical protein